MQVPARVVAFCKLSLLILVNNPRLIRVHKKLYPYYGHVTRVVRRAKPTRVWHLWGMRFEHRREHNGVPVDLYCHAEWYYGVKWTNLA